MKDFKNFRRNDSGQMAIELVVLLPAIFLILAIVVVVLAFAADCSRFDKVSAEAVRVHGIYPNYGDYSKVDCEQNIKQEVALQFASRTDVEIEVVSADIGAFSGANIGGDGLGFSFIPSYRKYTCTINVRPMFFQNGVFGMQIPSLIHTKEYVVDPYAPSGWM